MFQPVAKQAESKRALIRRETSDQARSESPIAAGTRDGALESLQTISYPVPLLTNDGIAGDAQEIKAVAIGAPQAVTRTRRG